MMTGLRTSPRIARLVALAIVVCSTGVPALADQTFALRPVLDYRGQRSGPVTHRIDFRVVVTAPYHTEKLQVWLPLPQDNRAQQIGEFDIETFPEEVQPQISTEPVYGNQFAYFEFDHPQGAQVICLRYEAKVWQMTWNVDPETVQRVDAWPSEFNSYLQTSPLRQQAEFESTLARIVPEPGVAPGEDLHAVLDWVDRSLTYDHIRASLKADPDHAFEERGGHCSDYHGLCATMGRAIGFPTRVTYGLSLFPKNSPSHCKLEVFLPPYGWVSYDLSETQKLIRSIERSPDLEDEVKRSLSLAARRRLQAGFRENSWLLLTRGTDYKLSPPASRPVSVVRTIYAEADGVPLPDPDPANVEQNRFAWMTAHRYSADKPLVLPFKDPGTLDAWRIDRTPE